MGNSSDYVDQMHEMNATLKDAIANFNISTILAQLNSVDSQISSIDFYIDTKSGFGRLIHLP